MKVRKLNADGSASFGRGRLDYLSNSPEAVAQNVMTRLKLKTGEWFLEMSDGTPYSDQILGEHTKPLYDAAIRKRILETPGVKEIAEYQSLFNENTRKLNIEATISTDYGEAKVRSIL